MAWIIKCWIPVGEEEQTTYETKDDIEKTIESLRLMQPENRYIVVGSQIKCYIPVDAEDPEKCSTKELAQEDIDNHYAILQPYNIYEAVEIEDDNEEGGEKPKLILSLKDNIVIPDIPILRPPLIKAKITEFDTTMPEILKEKKIRNTQK